MLEKEKKKDGYSGEVEAAEQRSISYVYTVYVATEIDLANLVTTISASPEKKRSGECENRDG